MRSEDEATGLTPSFLEFEKKRKEDWRWRLLRKKLVA